MNHFSIAQTKREEEYRKEEERLPKETEIAITYFSMREIADADLKDILCGLVELLGGRRGFKEEDKFENLIRETDNGNTSDAKKRGRVSMKETYYSLIIQRRAKKTGPLSNSCRKISRNRSNLSFLSSSFWPKAF